MTELYGYVGVDINRIKVEFKERSGNYGKKRSRHINRIKVEFKG